MRRLLLAVAIVIGWMLIYPIMSDQFRAHAQGVIEAVHCGNQDTTVKGTTPMAVLMVCNLTTGPNGIIYVIATAEVNCTSFGTTQLFIGAGTSTVNGSKFIGHASGGTLTVDQMLAEDGVQTNISNAVWANTAGGQTTFTVDTNWTANLTAGNTIEIQQVVSSGGTGAGFNGTFTVVSVTTTTIVVTQTLASSPGTYTSGGRIWSKNGVSQFFIKPSPGAIGPILATQTLSGDYGFTQTTITAQLTGEPGGGGTYSIANGSLTIPANSFLFALNAPVGGLTAISNAMSQNNCGGAGPGGFVISAIAGSFTGVPNTSHYLVITLKNDITNAAVQWDNAQAEILTY